MNKTLTAAILLMASSYTGAAARTITASQFGAIPNDGKDDAPALRKAAEYCRNNPGTTFVLEPGVYDFFDPTAERIEREAISGAYGRGDLDVQYRLFKPKGPYVKALDFTGSKNLTIEGSGATLKIHGWYEVITLTQVKNTEIKGLSITYNRPQRRERWLPPGRNTSTCASTPHALTWTASLPAVCTCTAPKARTCITAGSATSSL